MILYFAGEFLMNKKKKNRLDKVVSQFNLLIKSALDNFGEPDEIHFTKTLFRYLRDDCEFGSGLSKTEFLYQYFRNPIAEKALLFAFMEESNNTHPEKQSIGNKWFLRNSAINYQISSIIEENYVILEMLDFLISGTQIQNALVILEKCGLKVDIEDLKIHVLNGDYFLPSFDTKISLAKKLLQKHHFILTTYPLEICKEITEEDGIEIED